MPTDAAETATRERASEQLEKLEKLVEALEQAGVEVPSPLTTAIKGVKEAIRTGEDLADACTSASAALAQYTNKVNEACGDDAVCQAREIHKWQANNVDYVLNWNNKNSVVRDFVRRTLQRFVPQAICHNLDLCKPRH